MVLLAITGAFGAEPVPVSVQTAPGRFEVSAVNASAAHAVAGAAEEGWRWLAGPLGLPDAFSSPIYVRVAAARAPDGIPFRVIVEPGGVVSVRIFADGMDAVLARRALVQGLLLRLAVARHGVLERLTAPLWLEHAAVIHWQTRADAAQLDASKLESERIAPPPLDALLAWQRGADEPRAFSVGALWLLNFLQNESGRAHEWPALLSRLLGGGEPLAALAACYPERFADAQERELWWQTGYHHARRVRTLPSLEANESHAQLGALARFVFAAPADDADTVTPLRDVLSRTRDPIVAAEVARRVAELERLVPALHPFYRNAGLALGLALRSGARNAAGREALCAAFEQDWHDAVEIHAATTRALDALEQRAR